MNFSKRGTTEHMRKLNSVSGKLKNKAGVSILLFLLLAVVFAGAVGISAGISAGCLPRVGASGPVDRNSGPGYTWQRRARVRVAFSKEDPAAMTI